MVHSERSAATSAVMATGSPGDLARLEDTRARIAARVVGRERELELILAAVAAGRDMLIEGPPGTSKSTLLRAITTEWGVPLVFVEGNADLTPAKLIGHHNPARVLREDYSADNFVDGPLLEAMREGGRHGGGSLRAYPARRDSGFDARDGAARDLGGPFHPGPGCGGTGLKSSAGRRADRPAHRPWRPARRPEAVAAPAEGTGRSADAAAGQRGRRGRPRAQRREPTP